VGHVPVLDGHVNCKTQLRTHTPRYRNMAIPKEILRRKLVTSAWCVEAVCSPLAVCGYHEA